MSYRVFAGNITTFELVEEVINYPLACHGYCIDNVPAASIPLSEGHFGHILNTWERSRGDYAVTMAMLDLLLGLYKGAVAMDTDGVLACVVWACQEVMMTCQGWRHRSKESRETLSTVYQYV